MSLTAARGNEAPEHRGTPPPRTPEQRKRALGLDRGAWFLLAPALIPILVLSVGPLLYGFSLAFTDSQAGRTTSTQFTGLANFTDLLHDSLFWESFRIGIIWAVSVTALQFVLALGLALLLNENLRFRWLARTLALVPWAMPEVVVGIMWRLVYHPDAGILNKTLMQLHLISENVDWLTSLSVALPAVIVVGVWAGMPQTTVVLLAGLQNVPVELKEAANLDGAGMWRRFTTVTWPAIKPVVIAVTALNFIWNFNSFGLVYVLTQGGPGGKTRLPMLFSYEEAFKYGQFGYAAAMGLVMVALIAVFLTLFLRKKLKEETA
ncbi:sugar ABC transporter permease [Streptomyces sp. NBC_01387]|uniref:carbohydrate ABC transporter permease n=1 Tax=unclassified Streptomyces TaxID=2593676 RepID=UPI0020245F9E|nr:MULTISPECIES: sugar ABC transporter permease [unclassified Streptomyces]MCX4551703.1 sugar ABC transporter permease [Streptomyces sp. NBC_01500]WSC23077.1 sugar ABC transporter permease [Streptomyces sp. NBC_01766]WSV56988.1 sugar ABC transporter permease [Streptomyces sp. NBC_01014]